jgi:radical SAM-linked protein
VAPFVPKPHTPFQWQRQDTVQESRDKIDYLAGLFKPYKRIHLRWADPEMSWLEGVFSRGDRSLALAVERAYNQGDVLTSWSDYFSARIWREAFSSNGLDPESYLAARNRSAPLPWDHIQTGPSKEFLSRELDKAMQERTTRDCRVDQCHNCGVCSHIPEGSRLEEQERYQDIQAVLNPAVGLEGYPETPELVFEDESFRKAVQLRLWYEKTGPAKYLSQLELQSVLERAMRKANIPLSFTQGYNQSPRLSFARALPVGVESLCEWCQVTLRRQFSQSQPEKTITQYLPQGLVIYRIEEIPLGEKPRPSSAESFEIVYHTEEEEAQSYVQAWRKAKQASSLPLRKRSKKGKEKTVEVREALADVKDLGPGRVRVEFDWSSVYINPLEIVRLITPQVGAPFFSLRKVDTATGVRDEKRPP